MGVGFNSPVTTKGSDTRSSYLDGQSNDSG